MTLKTLRFVALLFTVLVLGPSLAHLLELQNKIGLSKADYLTVQQIYHGWALLGIIVAGALLANLMLAIRVRKKRRVFALTLTAFLCIVATQVIFWTLTYPANAATDNWTMQPTAWRQLRSQWEYSHAAGTVLNLIAFTTLTLSILVEDA